MRFSTHTAQAWPNTVKDMVFTTNLRMSPASSLKKGGEGKSFQFFWEKKWISVLFLVAFSNRFFKCNFLLTFFLFSGNCCFLDNSKFFMVTPRKSLLFFRSKGLCYYVIFFKKLHVSALIIVVITMLLLFFHSFILHWHFN